jgi:hypothetical protein
VKARIVTARNSRTRRICERFLGANYIDNVVMVYRWPGQSWVRVSVPQHWETEQQSVGQVLGPDLYAHEAVHIRQFSTRWGPWVVPLLATILPLPVFFSGRWFIERRAFLVDILNGVLTVPQAVAILHSRYGMPWPRSMMRRWFLRELKKGERF